MVDASSWLRQGSNQTLTELTGSQATSISTQDTKLAELGTKITRLEASLAELRQQVCDKSKPPVDCTGSGYAHTSLCAHATRTASGLPSSCRAATVAVFCSVCCSPDDVAGGPS